MYVTITQSEGYLHKITLGYKTIPSRVFVTGGGEQMGLREVPIAQNSD